MLLRGRVLPQLRAPLGDFFLTVASLVDQVADRQLGSVANSHNIFPELRVEHGDRTVQVRNRMGDYARDRQRCRAVDFDDGATGQGPRGDELLKLPCGVTANLVILGRVAEPDPEEVSLLQRNIIICHFNLLFHASQMAILR